jgi:hypothetical protein
LKAWWRSRFAKWIVVIGAIVLAMVTAAIWRIGVIAMPHETGYFAPVFTPDGKSVLAISREVRAIVTGFGWEFFTPPASVRLVQDRFRLVSIRVADGGVTILHLRSRALGSRLITAPFSACRTHTSAGRILITSNMKSRSRATNHRWREPSSCAESGTPRHRRTRPRFHGRRRRREWQATNRLNCTATPRQLPYPVTS